MLTAHDFLTIKKFVEGAPGNTHLYGGVSISGKDTEGKTIPMGSGLINNFSEKPADSFIVGESICGYHYSLISRINLSIGDTHLSIMNTQPIE